MNNVFANTGGGGAVYYYNSASNNEFDYNNMYATVSFGYYNGSVKNSFSAQGGIRRQRSFVEL
ncbi:MAG: hypothetical protein H6551_01260 [Chitinophagales bacterium]|nr:hypothetical protein [Chitinophagales bacterium]